MWNSELLSLAGLLLILTAAQETGVPTLKWDREDPYATEVLIYHLYTGHSFTIIDQGCVTKPLIETSMLGKMILAYQIGAKYGANALRDTLLQGFDEELSRGCLPSEFVQLLDLSWGKNANVSPGGDHLTTLRYTPIYQDELRERKDFHRFLSANMEFTLDLLRYTAGLLVD